MADGDGRVSGDVPVWRFLPTHEPGTYIDCAVSACSLRLSRETGGDAAGAARSRLRPGRHRPAAARVAVDPTRDLEPGDEIVVRGAGFEPGAYYSISLCAAPPEDPDDVYGCVSSGRGAGADRRRRRLRVEFEVPDLDEHGRTIDRPPPPVPAGGDVRRSSPVGDGQLCDGVAHRVLDPGRGLRGRASGRCAAPVPRRADPGHVPP